MTNDYLESGIRFRFDSNKWSFLLKYDEETDYKKIQEAIEKTKAVDIIGILDNLSLVVMEVKNFRGYRIENKPRLENGHDPLELEVAQKVRDTLAAMLGAARNSTHLREHWLTYLRFITHSKKDVRVVLWLEEDHPSVISSYQIKRFRTGEHSLTKKLRQKLNWLTNKVLVIHSKDHPFGDSLSAELLAENN